MADNKQTFLLDLDIKEFTENALKAKGSIADIGSSENMSGLLRGIMDATAGLAIIGTAALALKTTFDLVFEGEQIKRTNALFNTMAESIGIAGEKLRNDLMQATGGLADDTQVLQAASKAITMMGDSAARLPEVMDLARKITMNFGGDVLDRFSQLNYAISANSTRMLKEMGIMVDTNQAMKDYAKSIGVSADMLTEAGRRQATFNAVIQYGSQNIKDVKGSMNDAITTSQQLKITIKELGEMFVQAFEKLAGPAVRSLLVGLRDMAHEAKEYLAASFGQGAEQVEGSIFKIRQQIKLLEDEVASMQKNKGVERNWVEKMLGIGGGLDGKIEADQKKIADLRKQLDEQEKKDQDLKSTAEEKEKQAAEAHKTRTQEKLIDLDKERMAEFKLHEDILRLKEEAAQKDINDAQSEEELANGRNELLLAQEEQFQEKKAELQRQADLVGGELHALYLEQINALDRQHISQKEALDRQYDSQFQKMIANQLRSSQRFDKAFSASAKKAAHDASGGMTQMGHLGQATFTSMQKNGSTMFQSLGEAAVNGSQSAADIMKGFFLNALADIAQSQGELYLVMGMAPGAQAYLAAGAGLLVLSGVLRALAGSSGGGGASSGGSIGGGGGGGSLDSGGGGGSTGALDSSAASSQVAAAQQKSVTLQVMGNYYDTDQTRTALMDVIRSATDATDFKYVQIGKT